MALPGMNIVCESVLGLCTWKWMTITVVVSMYNNMNGADPGDRLVGWKATAAPLINFEHPLAYFGDNRLSYNR